MAENENKFDIAEERGGGIDFDDLMRKYDTESRFRTPPGWHLNVIVFLAVAMSAFHFYTAGFGLLPGQKHGAVHLLFALVLVLLLYPIRSNMPKNGKIPLYDFGLAILAATPLIYLISQIDTIAMTRAGLPTDADIIMGFILIALLLEATRRISNPILPILAVICLLYCYFGGEIGSGLFHHKGFNIRRIVNHMYLGTEGIFGTPLEVSSTFVFMFILFGAILEKTGMGRFIIDLAMSLAGWASGGPAKVTVVASGLMGTISGSSVACVCTIGVFTIPLMKKVGYKPTFAGAVEACAATGGQIMPPVMGAGAFIMAQMLGIGYLEVALAAVIPALLYYFAVLIQVHFEAHRLGLKGLPRSMLPNVFYILREKGFLLLPLAAIVYLLVAGYTPLMSAFGGIIVSLILSWLNYFFRLGLLRMTHLDKADITKLRRLEESDKKEIDVSFLAAKGHNEKSIKKIIRSVHMERVGFETLLTPKRILEAFEAGARGSLSVACACACVGVIVGTGTLTGLALKIAGGIIALAGGFATTFNELSLGVVGIDQWTLVFTLILTMCASILLGTGLPTTANFIVTSMMAAPALIRLGVPPLAAYMFVFYFGISADLTPPVALAAYAGAGIAKADPMITGLISFKLALAGLLVPYIYVFNPMLLFINSELFPMIQSIITAFIGVLLLAMCTIGHYKRKLAWPLRILVLFGALGLLIPGTTSDIFGFTVLGVIYLIQTTLFLKENKIAWANKQKLMFGSVLTFVVVASVFIGSRAFFITGPTKISCVSDAPGIELMFNSSGEVVEVSYAEKQSVSEGDIIARIKNETHTKDYENAESMLMEANLNSLKLENSFALMETALAQLKINAAESANEAAIAALGLAKAYEEQYQSYLEKGLYSKTDTEANMVAIANAEEEIKKTEISLVNAKQNFEAIKERFAPEKIATAKKEVEVAAEKLVVAKTVIENDSVVAPFNAYINSLSIKIGDIIEPDSSVCEVLDLSKIWLYSLVDKYAVESIKPDLAVNVEFSNIENEFFSGKIVSVASEPLEQKDGRVLYEIRIELDKMDGRILPGMEATATIVY